VFLVQLFARVFATITVYGLLLFLPAGRIDWWRGWVLLALLAIGMITTRLWAFTGKEALLEQRRRAPIQPGQPAADKLLVVGFVLVFPAYVIFIPLDVFRFHLLPQAHDWAAGLGLVLATAGWLLITLAFRENAFAASIVTPQDDRGQRVVDSGVYRIVRHPIYCGVIAALIGIALWLQSTAAAVASIIPITLVVLRIVVEETFLRERLAGYVQYMERIRYRLLPGIW
jgi:protein-S-isoprenylcysteine O-methyltransferase Ste14